MKSTTLVSPPERLLYWYRTTLVRIIDGDTVVLNIKLGFDVELKNQHVRLAGINAPEIYGEEKEAGKKAATFLASILPEPGSNETIMVHTRLDKRGSFNRLLADIYYNNEHINSRLVAEGYAQPYNG